jgi:hypothetical protein
VVRCAALERERNLESDISEYMATIKELEANVQGLKQELTDYKLRAKKVLQQREATIHELTEKLTSPGTPNYFSTYYFITGCYYIKYFYYLLLFIYYCIIIL